MKKFLCRLLAPASSICSPDLARFINFPIAGPIRGQYPGHGIPLDQSEASIRPPRYSPDMVGTFLLIFSLGSFPEIFF